MQYHASTNLNLPFKMLPHEKGCLIKKIYIEKLTIVSAYLRGKNYKQWRKVSQQEKR